MSSTKKSTLKKTLNAIIFNSNSRAGLIFDFTLIAIILISICLVFLDSIESVNIAFYNELKIAELTITILFSIEYLLRLYCAKSSYKYAKSFFGIVDLLSILPTYLAFIITGAHYVSVIRVLRVLRIFRLLKLMKYVSEVEIIIQSLKKSARKLIVFLFMIITVVIILGSIIYLVEGENSGFTNIPISIYWAIVTLTTFGYGDLSPETPFGKLIASIIMILGYCIIAVPTGLVSVNVAEILKENESKNNHQVKSE